MWLILGIFLIIGSASALSTDLKDSYQRGENIIVKISGNILEPIFPEQVEFLRAGHIRVPLEMDVKRLGDDYYIWAIAPNPSEETNYSLSIEGVVTTVEGVVTEVDYLDDFSVGGELVDYSINPGFVFALDDFSVGIFSYLDEDNTIEVGGKSLVLKPGDNSIDFSVKDFSGAQLNFIQIGDYSMPAYVIGERTTSLNKTGSSVNITNGTIIEINDSDDSDEISDVVQYYCNELQGEICSANEICAGEDVNSLDGGCCVGSCNVPQEEESSGTSIGIIVILVAILILVFIWWKYRKTHRLGMNPLKEKVDKFEDAEGTP